MHTCPNCGHDLPDPKSIIRRCCACGRTLTRHDGLLCLTCEANGRQPVVGERT